MAHKSYGSYFHYGVLIHSCILIHTVGFEFDTFDFE